MHQFSLFRIEFHAATKQSKMHPNTTKRTKMPRTCALILLVQQFLDRVSCSNETIQNAPKHYKTHKNMSLGSKGLDRVRSLPKIPKRIRGMKFCVNCISAAVLHRVSCSNEKNPKCTQILQNESLHDFRVQWSRSGAFVAKNFDANLWHKLVL